MLHDIDFKLFLGVFVPDYTSRVMSAEKVNDVLLTLYRDIRDKNVVRDL